MTRARDHSIRSALALSILLLFAGGHAPAFGQGSLLFSGIPNQVTPEDTPTQVIRFAVSGGQGGITVVGSSSNSNLVRNENIRITRVNDVWQLVAVPSSDQHGTATINLIAQSAGGSTASASFRLDVFPLNDPPTVRIANPLDGKQFLAPVTIDFVADAKDVDGDDTVTKVEFFRDGQLLAEVRSRPFSYSWGPVSRGTYTLTAVATDDAGIRSFSKPVKIEVISSPVLPPGQRAGAEGDDPVSIIALPRLSVIALPIQKPLTVEFYTTNRSAVGGVLAIGGIDYVPKKGLWTFLPGGHTTTNLDVEVFGNTSDDHDRSFEVRWYPLDEASLASTNVVVRILDDDPPPRLNIANLELRVAEGNQGTAAALVTLELSPLSGKVVEVQFSSANGTAVAGQDYFPLNPIDNYVRFQPLQSQVTITNLVRLIDNAFNEPDRDFFIDAQVDPAFAILDPSQSRIHVTILDDDPLPTLAIRTTAVSEVVEGNSGVTNAIFSVSLTPRSGRVVTVQYATTTDGNATSGADYRPASGTLTFQPGETNKAVVVEILGDALHEGTESFFVALSNPANAVLSTPQAQGRIFDDEAAPVVSILDAAPVLEGNGGTTNATFQISLSSASSQAVTVNFATSNGVAVAGTDFVGKTNSVTFRPGDPLIQSISVAILSDNLSEPDETFFANLSDPVGATLGRNQATGTIQDDDPLPAISIHDAIATEDNNATNALFNLSLSSSSGLPVTVIFATANLTALADSDYLAAQGTVRFDPGFTNRTIRIPILGDAIHEDSETFQVRLGAAQNATIAVGEAVGTILDDDPFPEFSVQDTTVVEGDSGVTNAVFLVTLSAPSGIPVSVNLATEDDTALAGKDYSRFEGTLAFAPGQTNRTFTVPVLGDLSDETTEVFLIRLASPTNATIVKAEGRASIIDDDPLPALTIAGTSVAEGNSGTANVEFNVALVPASGQLVTVNFGTADGTATAPGDYSPLSGTLTFAPGETNKTLVVSLKGDTEDEPNETLFVRLANAMNAVLQVAEAQAVLINDDTVPALTISDATVSEGNSGTTNAVFVVSLTQPSGRPVTVEFSTEDGTATAGSDFVATTNKITFTPGQTNQTISIAVTADALNEKNETFSVNLFNPESATLARRQGQALILDDDPPPAISINDTEVTEASAGVVKAIFMVSLSTASGQSISVNYATTNGTAAAFTDYTPGSGTLTFAPGRTSATIEVEILGDALNEPAEEFFIQLTAPVNASIDKGLGKCRITDDDSQPELSINDVSIAEGDAGLGRAVFEVKLSAPSAQRITARFITVEGTAKAAADFVLVSGTLVFEPGDVAKPIIVLVNGDSFFEPNETFFVSLSEPVRATIARSQGQATILDDDSEPALSINDITVTEGNTSTVEAVFVVSLTAASPKAVSVDFATSGQTASAERDYVERSGTLTFSPGETVKPVAITIQGDWLDELDEAFTVILSKPVNATLTKAQGRGVILDDDDTPTLVLRDETTIAGKTESGKVSVAVNLSAASSQRVTVGFATSNGTASAFSDYKATSGLLIFEPGETNQVISVEILGDDLHEEEEHFFVTLSSATNARLTATQWKVVISDDDPVPALSINDLAIPEGSGQPRKALFEVTLSAATSQDVSVDFTTSDGTAAAGKDFAANSGTLVIASGQTAGSIAVLVQGDLVDEANESFKVTLSNAKNASIARGQAQGTIIDDDSETVLSIDDASVIEGQGGVVQAVFVVRLSGDAGQSVTVDYATANGAALAGSDYQAQSGTLTFNSGEAIKAISIPIFGDTIKEANETFSVSLVWPINATVLRGQAVGTIIDDDPPPTLSIADTAVTEGNSNESRVAFIVSLSSASSEVVAVDFSTADATAAGVSDYEPVASGRLIFNSGDTRQAITVAIKGDAIPEAQKTFIVNLANAVNATILDGQAVCTITDDDMAIGLSIADAAVSETDLGFTNITFNVNLSAASSEVISVAYETLDNTAQAGSDYASAFGTLTFPPGITSQAVTVQVRGDSVHEDDESFFVRLSDPRNAVILDNRAVGAITDNDRPPMISISDTAVTEGNQGTVSANFTVTLSAASAKSVSVTLTTVEGNATAGRDFQPATATVTLLPNTTSLTVSVPVNGDTEDEPSETFSMLLSNPVNAVLGNPRALCTIIDDDVPPTLSITDGSAREGNSGTTFAEFTVRLSAPSPQTVIVNFRTADRTAAAGGDYTAANGTLTFAPGAVTNIIRVLFIGDAINEPDETFEIKLADPTHARLGRDIGVGTILDDDVLPTLTITDATIEEGNTGPANAVFVVRLSAASAQNVTVGFQTANGTATAGNDYRAISSTLEFAPGAVSRNITVEVNGDTEFEPDETFTVNLVNPVHAALADAQGVGTIRNDDSAANSPPTIRIINPATGAAFASPAEVLITVDAFDRDGAVQQVEFFVGSTSLGSASGPPFNFLWKNDAAGAYSITARATDDKGAVSVSEPANILMSRRAAGAEVAIIRNFADPEIRLIQNYLLEMGISSQVFEQEGLSFEAVTDAKLIIWDDLGSVDRGLTDQEVAIFQQASDWEIPLYFIGEALATSTRNLGVTRQSQWSSLIHLTAGAAHRSDGAILIEDVSKHPVVIGHFGTVGRFNGSPNVEGKLEADAGVVLLGKSGAADLIAAFEDPFSEARRSVTQNCRLTADSNAAGISEQKKLFKNAVAWLMRRSFQALTDISVSVEGPADPVPAGREITYTIAIQHQGEIEGTGVEATIALPAGMKLVKSEFVQGTLAEMSGTVIYTLGNMASAQRATVSLTVLPTSGGTLAMRVNVVGNEPDPNSINNSATLETVVTGGAASVPVLKPSGFTTEGFQMTVTGAASGTFRVQSSLDLARWTDLTTFTGRSTPILVTDPAASRSTIRFYRVISP